MAAIDSFTIHTMRAADAGRFRPWLRRHYAIIGRRLPLMR